MILLKQKYFTDCMAFNDLEITVQHVRIRVHWNRSNSALKYAFLLGIIRRYSKRDYFLEGGKKTKNNFEKRRGEEEIKGGAGEI